MCVWVALVDVLMVVGRGKGVKGEAATRERFFTTLAQAEQSLHCATALFISSSLLHQKQAVVRAATCGLGPG